MSKIKELKMESRHKKYFTDPTTNSFKSGQDDAGQPAIGENEFANVNKRRRSVSNQPRVHPATRLAAFAMQSSETTTEKHVNSAPSEFSGSYKDLSTHIKKLWPTSHSIDPGRLRGVSSSSPRQSSDQTMSTMRILRPRYPRTPIPVTALLLKPKRSPRNPRKSTDVKSSQLFPPLSATVTTDTASLNSQSPAPETVSTPESALLLSPKLSPMKLRNSTALKSSHLFPPLSTSATTDNSNCNPDTPVSVANTTPKPRTPRLRSRSGSRLTPVGRRTPRNKTPGSVKYSESATPKTSRSGTPKGTQKFLKETSSYVCEVCAEVILEKKEMLKHQRLHGKNKTQDKTATANKAVLTRTPKSGKMNHEKYECDVCRKNFKFRSNLKPHRLLHEQPKLFQCRSCEKNLLVIAEGTDRLLVEKLVKPEAGSSEIVCKDCCYGENMPNAGGRRAVHSFVCDKCPRTFRLETNLKIHLKTHAIEKIRDILKTSSRLTAE